METIISVKSGNGNDILSEKLKQILQDKALSENSKDKEDNANLKSLGEWHLKEKFEEPNLVQQVSGWRNFVPILYST